MQAGADGDRSLVAPRPFEIVCGDPVLNGDAGAQRVVARVREQRHDRVADVLVDDAAVLAHGGPGAFQQFVDEAERLAGRHRFGQRRERPQSVKSTVISRSTPSPSATSRTSSFPSNSRNSRGTKRA